MKTHLALYDQNRFLEEKVKERTEELALTRDVTILSLVSLAETRDNETGGHIKRTQRYIRTLAEYLMPHKEFRDFLDEDMIDLLFKSAPLHDIGKVGIPDNILLKPGKLTDDEFIVMKKHPIYGYEALVKAEDGIFVEDCDDNSTFLSLAREVAYNHHEKWDGTGYPQGLRKEEITISGRLMAIADVYDALISRRIYKPPFTHEKAVTIISEGRGSHFDPDMIVAFLEIQEMFRQIALEFADSDEERKMLSDKMS